MRTRSEELSRVLVTDCGSTTTKALLFEKSDDGWKTACRGESPTTVEEPVADVTVGALNAFSEVEELSGRKILSGEEQNPFIITNADHKESGIDLYLSTSSAGGGLQMLVSGIVRKMSAESAERAALGAGAIVMDVISADDGREDHERIERIRHLKPDIFLISGGIEGGSKTHVVETAELLAAAAPRPRFGETLKLPVIYAGNSEAADEVAAVLEGTAQFKVVENLRPQLDRENLGATREAVHEFFLSHVMSHAPGYGKLLQWTPVPVMPTPAAVGDMILRYANHHKQRVLCADIGGATTDVFSVFNNASGELIFNRTVSANLGMSYSIANVLLEAGAASIAKWLPYKLNLPELSDRLRNKMIRPTSIPQTKDDLFLEQAVCREALRLSLDHHKMLAVGLGGRQQRRGIADIFSQKTSRYELVDLMKLDLVIGSGGVLSHAPDRLSAALMMIDGFGLMGITELAVDSVFMLPHLGVLCGVYPEAADQIFLRDCLVRIAHSIIPTYDKHSKKGEKIAILKINGRDLATVESRAFKLIPQVFSGEVDLQVQPLRSDVDVGSGPGVVVNKKVVAAPQGWILDGRNRPMDLPSGENERIENQRKIFAELGLL